MSRDELRTGCVIRFPYLWVRESERGETEGRKSRPVAVGVRITRPSFVEDQDLPSFNSYRTAELGP